MMLTHEATGIRIDESNQRFALNIVAKGGEHLMIGVSYGQIVGLAAQVATIARRRQDKSPDRQDQ
jgi:hypothetical protein